MAIIQIDHLYAFFMSNTFWDKNTEYTIFPEDSNTKDAAKVKLSELGLEKGRLFKFLFDFGDEWKFQCCVLEMPEKKVSDASVTESVGEAPQQYPDYDEDYDDWDDEDDDCDYGGLSPEVAKKYEKTNDKMLKLFKKSLTGLTEKTISNHLDNADFYINDYLLYRCGYSFEQGITEINEFFGYFFIRKCTWSTPGNIKTTAVSIKKFYKCMMENGKIGNDDYTYLCDTIKAGMKEWQDTCAQYNDEDYDDPFEY